MDISGPCSQINLNYYLKTWIVTIIFLYYIKIRYMEIVNLVNDKCQVIDSATGQIMFEGSYDDCFMCLATYEDEDALYRNHLLMSGI